MRLILLLIIPVILNGTSCQHALQSRADNPHAYTKYGVKKKKAESLRAKPATQHVVAVAKPAAPKPAKAAAKPKGKDYKSLISSAFGSVTGTVSSLTGKEFWE